MILVAGSNGMLGQVVVKRLHYENKMVRGSVRGPINSIMERLNLLW